MKPPKVEFKRILYTTEFSENAQTIHAYATKIANQFDAKLTLLHVIPEELFDLLVFDVGIERSPGVQKRLSLMKDHFTNSKKTILKKIKAEYGEKIVNETDIVVEKGNPVKTILRVAEEKNCDLIVMGIKGRGTSKLENATMGDTVRRVLHRSKLPVLVVQNKDKKGKK